MMALAFFLRITGAGGTTAPSTKDSICGSCGFSERVSSGTTEVLGSTGFCSVVPTIWLVLCCLTCSFETFWTDCDWANADPEVNDANKTTSVNRLTPTLVKTSPSRTARALLTVTSGPFFYCFRKGVDTSGMGIVWVMVVNVNENSRLKFL
jgi:hypothetical protein